MCGDPLYCSFLLSTDSDTSKLLKAVAVGRCKQDFKVVDIHIGCEMYAYLYVP